MIAEKATYVSPEEYLDREEDALEKSEYIDGEVFPMPGVTEFHDLITGNIIFRLKLRLLGQPCRVHTSDVRVEMDPSKTYAYPDVTVVCGPSDFIPNRKTATLLNPTVIVEVLSPSTEDYDQGLKAMRYRARPTLAHLLLVSQKTAWVQHFARQADGSWSLRDVTGLEAVITLPDLGMTLPMSEVYEGVGLDDAPFFGSEMESNGF